MARKTETRDAHLSMRMEASMLDAIDAEVARMASERPGLRVARTDVVRMLLHEGLAARQQSRKGAKVRR